MVYVLFRIAIIDSSFLIIGAWQISSSCRMLFTLKILPFIGEMVAIVWQYPKSPRGNVILNGELL